MSLLHSLLPGVVTAKTSSQSMKKVCCDPRFGSIVFIYLL